MKTNAFKSISATSPARAHRMCAVRAGGMDAVLREHTPPRAKRCFLVTSLHQQRSYPLLAAEALFPKMKEKALDSSLRRNEEQRDQQLLPQCYLTCLPERRNLLSPADRK